MTIVKTILRKNPSGLFVFRVLADDIILINNTFDSREKFESVVHHTLKSLELAVDIWLQEYVGEEITVAIKSPEKEPF